MSNIDQINELVSSDFKKMVNAGYLNQLEKIMSLCSDEEAIYILNLTLKVIDKRFKNMEQIK